MTYAPRPPRCIVCKALAVHDEPRHRAAWCSEHLVDHVHRQIRKAIDTDGMFSYADRLLVAVSGGKDSIALWDALLTMGYNVDGLYVGLGIGGYSNRSEAITRDFARAHAAPRGRELVVVDMEETYGYTTPSGAAASGRATCGVCGLSKRYAFDRAAVEGGYDVVLTGHNLDDEAATLLGNIVRWQDGFLARQRPVLESKLASQPKKVKPLYRLSEREMAAYCVVRGLDYVVEECPLVDGNKGIELKHALNMIEAGAPGSKAQFLYGFLERADAFGPQPLQDQSGGVTDPAQTAQLGACNECGMPATGNRCAFCSQRAQILDGAARKPLPILTTAKAPS